MQTYSGSRDVWGLKDERPEEGSKKGFVPPIFDDGLLEVVGLEGGFKSWAALSGLRRQIHGSRIAQAAELRIRLQSPKRAKSTPPVALWFPPFGRSIGCGTWLKKAHRVVIFMLHDQTVIIPMTLWAILPLIGKTLIAACDSGAEVLDRHMSMTAVL